VPSPTRKKKAAARPRRHSSNGGSPARKGRGRSAGSDNVSVVYDALRSLIIQGQLPPGARIAERAVVDRMGVSRTPVRSALHRLLQEGFVASVGRAGDQRLIVTPLTQSDGREVLRLIGHLEGLAAREAAELGTEKRRRMVQALKLANKALASAARDRGSPARVFDLDYKFHNTYVDGVAGPRVSALHRAIKPQAERYVRLYVNVLLDQLAASVKEHGLIIDAIASGDADRAQAAVERNWRNASDRLARVIAEHGERGIWDLWKPG
jgi:DNA-binding GntR family transcriptional regulator